MIYHVAKLFYSLAFKVSGGERNFVLQSSSVRKTESIARIVTGKIGRPRNGRNGNKYFTTLSALVTDKKKVGSKRRWERIGRLIRIHRDFLRSLGRIVFRRGGRAIIRSFEYFQPPAEYALTEKQFNKMFYNYDVPCAEHGDGKLN